MKNCATEPTVASMLPDFARNAHGNLAEQNRLVGAQRGADTTRPAGASPAAAAAPAAAPAAAGAAPNALLAKHTCSACHQIETRVVGPSFREIAAKYAGKSDAQAYLEGKIKAGGTGVWGQVPMPPQALGPDDARTIAKWLTEGAPK
jgi:S-disulfanyl-L-cysteine oxidoreductase SoxD